jgi:hypothetical protein
LASIPVRARVLVIDIIVSHTPNVCLVYISLLTVKILQYIKK